MTKLTSFAADIRPLFMQRDIQGMSKAFNLANYDDVKAHATAIFDRIRGIGGLSYHRRRREAKVAGLNPASISSLNGWQTVINAKRSPDRNVNINGSFESSSLAAMSAIALIADIRLRCNICRNGPISDIGCYAGGVLSRTGSHKRIHCAAGRATQTGSASSSTNSSRTTANSKPRMKSSKGKSRRSKPASMPTQRTTVISASPYRRTLSREAPTEAQYLETRKELPTGLLETNVRMMRSKYARTTERVEVTMGVLHPEAIGKPT